MTIDATKYTVSIQKRDVDGETMFSARVKELPDVEVFEATSEQAYSVALQIITSLASLADEDGRKFPAPSKDSDEEFSGRVTLRMPRGLHQKIAAISGQEGVSLNQYIVTVLASASGETSFFLRTKPEISEAIAKKMEWQAADHRSHIVTFNLDTSGIDNWRETGKYFRLLAGSFTAKSALEDDDLPHTMHHVAWERPFGKVK